MPVLYWVTFIIMCFLQPLQKARFVFGTFTCTHRPAACGAAGQQLMERARAPARRHQPGRLPHPGAGLPAPAALQTVRVLFSAKRGRLGAGSPPGIHQPPSGADVRPPPPASEPHHFSCLLRTGATGPKGKGPKLRKVRGEYVGSDAQRARALAQPSRAAPSGSRGGGWGSTASRCNATIAHRRTT